MLFEKQNRKVVVGAIAGVAVYLFPRIMFGQEAAEVASPWWADLLVTVLVTFSTAIAGLLVLGVRKGVQWVAGKVDSSYLTGAIQRSGPLLEELVDGMYKEFVRPLKRAGKWDTESGTEAKAAVRARLRVLLGADGLKKLAHILGAPETVDVWIEGLIERTVIDRKTSGRKAKALRVAGANPTKG